MLVCVCHAFYFENGSMWNFNFLEVVDVISKYSRKILKIFFDLYHTRGNALTYKNSIFSTSSYDAVRGYMERYNPGEHHEIVLKNY